MRTANRLEMVHQQHELLLLFSMNPIVVRKAPRRKPPKSGQASAPRRGSDLLQLPASKGIPRPG